MGQIVLPASGKVYVDANVVIYSIEKILPYRVILQPLWESVRNGSITVITSEMTILETLVNPFLTNDTTMENLYRELFASPEVELIPISQRILERAARLRSTTRLRTPDAIHAATALETACTLFLTNDRDYRRCTPLPLALLSDYVDNEG
jgi:predicted nucleic acid-binding protein